MDPRLIEHMIVTVGLVPPEPHESTKQFRERRRKQSWPSPKLYPFTSTLWQMMGFQPPLAKVLVEFCKGYNEVQIAEQMGLSVYNVKERLRKSVQIGHKQLRI